MSVVAVRKPFCGEMRSEEADAALPPRGSGSEDATNECGCRGAGGVHVAHYLSCGVQVVSCVARFGAAGYNFRPRIDRVALSSELNGAFCFILL